MPEGKIVTLGIVLAMAGIVMAALLAAPLFDQGGFIAYGAWVVLLAATLAISGTRYLAFLAVLIAYWAGAHAWLWISPWAAIPTLLLAVAATTLTQVKPTIPNLLLLVAGVAIVGYSGEAGSSDRLRALLEMIGIGGPVVETVGFVLRKVAHFVIYGTIAVAACRSLSALSVPRRYAVALIFAATLGAADELAQGLTETRTASAWDWLLDMSGAVTFLAILRKWEKTRNK